MEWFRPGGPEERPATVSVLAAADGAAVGSGVLLPRDRFVTCAHVVDEALGRPGTAPTEHPEAAVLRVLVYGAEGPPHLCTARLTVWIPPGPECAAGAVEWDGDLAVLELDGPPPAVRPPRWRAMAGGQSVRAWHGGGHDASLAEARVLTCDGRIGYVDGASLTGVAIDRGYSGGPLWSGQHGAVVGLVAAALTRPGQPADGAPFPYDPQHVARRSWGIPWQRIREELARAGAAHILDGLGEPGGDGPPGTPGSDGSADPVHRAFADILGRALADPALRAECARAVAARHGWAHRTDGSAPSVDEFTRLLVRHERALAALTEVLHAADPGAVAELLAAGRMSAATRLLSPGELARLTACLTAFPAAEAARLPTVVRAALPLADLPGALLTGADWGGQDPAARASRVSALVAALEGLLGDSRSVPRGTQGVPGLLRVVEYTAAVCPERWREELRLWSAAVAARLGVHGSALEERRSDAEEWARRQGASTRAPRVLVRLAGHAGGAGADRYVMRMWCDEGAGPRPVSDGTARPRSAAEAAEEILAVLEPLHAAAPVDGPRTVIELLVDREALELPVDEWTWPGPAGLVPGVLGAEYPLTVNCPDLVRLGGERFKAAWRRRWQRLDDGEAVHIDRSTGGKTEVYGLLMERSDASRVTLGDVPEPVRADIVQVCLAMGVPVVLWDRSGAPSSHVAEEAAGVPARGLPERVRAYRAKTIQQPRSYPGRPVLAWADAERPLPHMELADPTEPS